MRCHALLLQGIFATQGSNPHLLHLALTGGFVTARASREAPRRDYVGAVTLLAP